MRFYNTYRPVSSVNFNFFYDYFTVFQTCGANLGVMCAILATAIGTGDGFDSEVFFNSTHFSIS